MKNRTVIELVVLALTLCVVLSIFGLLAAIIIVELTEPDIETGPLARSITTLISAIALALLGMLVGKKINGKDDHPDAS